MVDYGNWTTKAKHHRGHSTLPHVGASLLDFCAHQLELSEETMGQMIQLKGEYQKSTWRGLCCWKRNKWAPQSAIFMGSSFQMSFPARARIIPNFPKKFTLNSHFKLFWNANIRDKILWNRFVKTEMCQSRTHLSVHSELKTITEMEKLKNQLLKKLALFFLFFLGGEGKSDSCCLLKMKSWFYSLWLAWLVILIFSQQNCLKAFAFFIYVFSQM